MITQKRRAPCSPLLCELSPNKHPTNYTRNDTSSPAWPGFPDRAGIILRHRATLHRPAIHRPRHTRTVLPFRQNPSDTSYRFSLAPPRQRPIILAAQQGCLRRTDNAPWQQFICSNGTLHVPVRINSTGFGSFFEIRAISHFNQQS